MTISQWLILCHLWQKDGVILDDESSLVVRGRVSIVLDDESSLVVKGRVSIGHFC